MDCLEIKGVHNTIKIVDPKDTYFIAEYKDKKIKGGGLEDTGWNKLPHGIIKLVYHLSTGTIIEIPSIFKAYLHLVEVSRSLLDDKVLYHFVYIKCLKDDDEVISYRISLKEDMKNKFKIGDLYISKEKKIDNPHWKEAKG